MTALKITSCLSVAAAFIIIYSLINEMQDGGFLRDCFSAIFNPDCCFGKRGYGGAFLAGKIKLIKGFLIIQIFILILTGFMIFQILFNSTISD
jgi:hypothetical protein